MQLINESTNGIEVCTKNLYKGSDIKGVLFDMDGVILDSEKLYTRFWKEASAALGFHMTHEMALGMRSLNPQLATIRIKEYFGEEAEYLEIREKRIELMNVYVEAHGIELKPGVCEILQYLKSKGIKAAIASASPLDLIQKYLSEKGVIDYFDALVSARMVEHGKPEPDVYLYAAAKLDLAPEMCLVVEDSPTGLLAGNRAGCVPIMVPDQDLPDEKVKSTAFAVVENLATIQALFH